MIIKRKNFSLPEILGAGTIVGGSILGAHIGGKRGEKRGRALDREEEEKSRKAAEENLKNYIPEAKRKIEDARELKKDLSSEDSKKHLSEDVRKLLIDIQDRDIVGYQYSIDRLEGKYGKEVAENLKRNYIESNTIRTNKNETRERRKGKNKGTALGLLGGTGLVVGSSLLAKKLKK